MSLIVTCFAGPFLRQTIVSYWASYKARLAPQPIVMTSRGDRWRASRVVARIDMAGECFAYFGLLCVGAGFVGAVYGATH